jgi:hypothetical protein
LAHKKILTIKNLKNKGISGPSRRVMCQNKEEKTQHLFIECCFVKEAWSYAMGILVQWLSWPQARADLFNHWGSHYRWNFKKNPIFK